MSGYAQVCREESLDSLAERFKELHGKVCATFARGLKHAKACGAIVASVKAMEGMSHERFAAWCESVGISVTCAENYAKIHKNWPSIKDSPNITSALGAIASTRKVTSRKSKTPADEAPQVPANLTTFQRTVLERMQAAGLNASELVKVVQLLEMFGVKEQVETPVKASAPCANGYFEPYSTTIA